MISHNISVIIINIWKKKNSLLVPIQIFNAIQN